MPDPHLDYTSDTRLEWIHAWVTPDHKDEWAWYATHAASPGAWGIGATREAALDDLASVIPGWHSA